METAKVITANQEEKELDEALYKIKVDNAAGQDCIFSGRNKIYETEG